MKNNNKADAISHIDDDLLESALLMRQSLQNEQVARKAARKLSLRKMAILAACVAALGATVTLAVVAAPAEESEETTEVAETEDILGIIYFGQERVWLSRTLDEIYAMEPYNLYLPRSGFEDLELTYSYIEDKYEHYRYGNPDALPIEYGDQANIGFANSPESDYFLLICVDKQTIFPENSWYVTESHHRVNYSYIPYDPTDVESYERASHELSYYKSKVQDLSEEHKRNVFLPQDVTLEVIQNLYHDTSLFESESDLSIEDSVQCLDESVLNEITYDGHRYLHPEQIIKTTTVQGFRFSFEICILIDDYTVSYSYYGNDITPEMMYEMITSAEYFAD